MKPKIITLLAFASLTVAEGFAQNKIWQIGTKDGSGREFSLYTDYRSFGEKYPGGSVLYSVGSSSSKDMPWFLPGPSDSWAEAEGRFLIKFGISSVEEGSPVKLRIDLVESHPGLPPVIEIRLNDYQVKVDVPAGRDQGLLENPRDTDGSLYIEAEFPTGTIRKGNNILSLRSVSGSWIAIDAISLEASGNIVPGRISGPDIVAANAVAAPALIYGPGGKLLQPLKIDVENWGKSRKADLRVDGKPAGSYHIAPGMNRLEASVAQTDSKRSVQIELVSGKNSLGTVTTEIYPVKEWTVYLVQHTHTDIGYTKPQTEILMEHLRYIDYAIEYCELTEDYPDDAKFRWTCEASWAVNEYLKNRPAGQIEKLKKYIANGQIEATAMFFNMSEVVDENSLKTFLKPLARYHENGIPAYTAMQNDVNGIAWALADYLPDAGVKYVWMGEHGHRALIPFEVPTAFKWQSPSGKEILAYRADHYNTGNFWGIEKHDMALLEPKVFDYLSNLDDKGYTFDVVGVQYSGYFTDNSPPSYGACKLIEEWNRKYASPRLRNALPHEFMDYIAENHAGGLQTLRVAYPDWWTDGFGSAARETGASRSTHADMVTVEGMLSMAVAKGQSLPEHTRDEIIHIHENLLFYDEHTFGAAESLRDPMNENSQVQWAEKGSFVWEALKSAQLMYETSAGLLQDGIKRGKNPTITFFNSMAWTRSELAEVYIDYEVIPRNRSFSIVDEQGNVLEVQALRSRSEGRYYAVYAEDIPAMGYKTYDIVVGKEYLAPVPQTQIRSNVVENRYYRITFNPATGAISSLYDKELGLEIVDGGAEWEMGAFIYEKLEDRHQMERYVTEKYERTGLHGVNIASGADGPIYTSVNISGQAPGIDAAGMQVEIKLFNNVKRIEFAYSVRRLPETAPTGIYVAFPFTLDNSRLAFEVQGGVVYPGENQLEGTASDWNTVQNFVAARSGQAQIVMGSDVVPLMQLGDMLDGRFQYRKTYEKPHVYSWVMNNYWVTNFRASQEGEFRWNYHLTTTADTSNTAASKFGWSSRIPLYARVMPQGKENGFPMSWSAFGIDAPNLLMTSCTVSKDDGWLMLNVRELDGIETKLTLTGRNGRQIPFLVVNAIEEPLGESTTSDRFAPFENKFIKFKP